MSSSDAPLMPFGKYQGERVDTVAVLDPSYLRWALEEERIAELELYVYIREALRRRGELNE